MGHPGVADRQVASRCRFYFIVEDISGGRQHFISPKPNFFIMVVGGLEKGLDLDPSIVVWLGDLIKAVHLQPFLTCPILPALGGTEITFLRFEPRDV